MEQELNNLVKLTLGIGILTIVSFGIILMMWTEIKELKSKKH